MFCETVVSLGQFHLSLDFLVMLAFVEHFFPGPGAGMYPSRSGFGGGGSMFIGPNDPSWFGDLRWPGIPRGQPGVPPGERFDPYGPPNVPGFEPGRFVRNSRRPGGDTHPDLEHFRRDSDFI